MANSVLPKSAHDWLKHELDPCLFRRAGTIKSGAGALVTGQVLGQITVGTAASAAKAGGNTGNGTLTLDAVSPVLAGAKLGVYAARCVAAAGNGGTFEVQDPDGYVLGTVAVGGTWSEGVKFVIADGAADFVVGDGFDVTVAKGSGKFVPVSATAKDGSQVAAAIVIDPVDATSADVETAVLVRNAQIVSSHLVWPAGATSDQKGVWLDQLAAAGIADLQRY